jgi:hypothetical protein
MQKQLPFRYPEELEKDIEEVTSLQHWSKSKNKAIHAAVVIAASLIRKAKKEINKGRKKKLDEWDLRHKIFDYINKKTGTDISYI